MLKWLSSMLLVVAMTAACVFANLAPLPRKPKPPTQPATATAPQPNAPAGG